MGQFKNILFLGLIGLAVAKLPPYLAPLLKFGSSLTSGTSRQMSDDQDEFENVYVKEKKIATINLDGHDEMTRQFANEAAPAVQIQMNPIMGKLLKVKMGSESVDPYESDSFYHQSRAWFNQNQNIISAWLWRIPVALLSFGVIFIFVGVKGAARTCVGLCYFLGRQWLFLLSFLSVVLFLTLKINMWSYLPPEFWSGPILSIVICLVLFRVIDVNFPIWNSSLSSFLAPLASCIIILVLDKIGIGKLLASANKVLPKPPGST
jgi:hypothetical protein